MAVVRLLIGKMALLFLVLPLTGAILLFAVANRHWVTVSFDPLSAGPPALAVQVPLFLAILLAIMLGVVVGGVASWSGQAKWRRLARRRRAELSRLRAMAVGGGGQPRPGAPSAMRTSALSALTYRSPPR